MSHTHCVDSETGRLRTVLVHRPGAELRRITPRAGRGLQFTSIPWVARAQQEHDILAQALRDQGAEVLYFTEVLQDTLEYAAAREAAIGAALSDPRLGEQLRRDVGRHLAGLDSESLTQVLVAGLAPEEFRNGRGLVYGLLDRQDFVIDPLPNMVFIRDASGWISGAPVVTSLTGHPRRRECALARVVYTHHPRFAGTPVVGGPDLAPVAGGDVMMLAPGVVAAGVGEHTTPAGVERLARQLFAHSLARTVLAVPLARVDASAHLDTVCTVVDRGTMLMAPAAAYTLRAHVITPGADGLRVTRPRPFLEAAAEAMGVESVTVIGTGLSPSADTHQQWDDGGNALAVAPRVLVSHERNAGTNERLEAAGVQVIKVPGSELGGRRGGPRCMACPVAREPAVRPGAGQDLSVAAPAAPTAPPCPPARQPDLAVAGPAGGAASRARPSA